MNTQLRSDRRHPLWDALRQHLEARRRPVEDQIRRYPPPIAGCDAQFNYLLEQRAVLSRELVRLDKAEEAARTGPAAVRAAEDFISGSSCIDPDAAAQIRAAALSTQPQ